MRHKNPYLSKSWLGPTSNIAREWCFVVDGVTSLCPFILYTKQSYSYHCDHACVNPPKLKASRVCRMLIKFVKEIGKKNPTNNDKFNLKKSVLFMHYCFFTCNLFLIIIRTNFNYTILLSIKHLQQLELVPMWWSLFGCDY